MIDEKIMGKIQVGKQGVTDNFIVTLKSMFKTHKNVKISLLKSSGRDREKIKETVDEILEKLGNHYTARVIGFTIVVKKWRKDKR